MKYNYSDAIIKLRVKLNVSQSELAKILGVSFSSVNRWETCMLQLLLQKRN